MALYTWPYTHGPIPMALYTWPYTHGPIHMALYPWPYTHGYIAIRAHVCTLAYTYVYTHFAMPSKGAVPPKLCRLNLDEWCEGGPRLHGR